MRKKGATGAAAAARAVLAARGLDPDAPLDALDALASAWGSAPEVEAAALVLAGGLGDSAAGERIAALEARTTHRSIKREIKRALYRLEQRGVWQAPSAPPPPSTTELMGPPDEGIEAWVSPIDSLGMRALWLARRTHEGVDSLTAFIGDDGVHETYSGATTRKALRKMLHDLSTERRLNLVETPWGHAHTLLTRAIERTGDEARRDKAARELQAIAPGSPTHAAHPLDALLERASVASDAAALAESGRALGEREMAGWLLPREWVDASLDQVDDAGTSMIVLSPVQQQERVRSAIDRAVTGVLDASERREIYADRLEETAYLFARRGAVGHARASLAAALALRAGRPIGEIPLLDELARRSLGLALEIRASEAKEQSASSLVVTPAQALAEAQRPGGRRLP